MIKQTSLLCSSLLAMLVLLFPGCSQHPRASSPESVVLIQRYYTACNTENVDRLESAKQRKQELLSSGKISQQEADVFDRIEKLGDAGSWEEAAAMALQFAEDQIGR